jgi:hypothetical protein
VPIVRRERAIGVLCVQHVDPRRYEDVEIEALQTVAMVLAELIATTPAWSTSEESRPRRQRATGFRSAPGLQLVKGLALGQAVFHQPRITIEQTVAEDTEAERQRVYLAFDKMREQIDRMASRPSSASAASTRRCSRPTRCSPTTKAGAADQRGDRFRPDRRGGDRARPAAHPDADAPDRRPAAGRPDARSGGPVEPAAADRFRPARHGGQQSGLRNDTILIAATSARPSCSNMTGGG